MITDADIEQAEWEHAGRLADSGVCPACEEPLNPRLPKWERGFADALDRFRENHGADSYERDGRTYTPWTAASVERVYGPADSSGLHKSCWDAAWA